MRAHLRLYDSHCHLDFDHFDEDRDAVVERARAVGIERIVVPGVAPSQWARASVLLERYPEVRPAIGLHPEWLGRLPEQEVSEGLRDLEARAGSCGAVAIGECGLDGRYDDAPGAGRERQERVFLHHLEVAEALGLPMILHIVRAHGRAIELLEARGSLAAGGVIHAYSGSAELVPRYAALGFSFGLGGAITHLGAKNARRSAAAIPASRLLVETDAPDQSPRGYLARNEPASLHLVLEELGRLRQVSPEELAERTHENARRLFEPEERRARAAPTC